ncbi:MAG TPA: alpha-L-fucosidase, partial [Vicinamibacteria bacterium]|nr:alpha-L-fucosidase [Vicinamibacteria bacterium]
YVHVLDWDDSSLLLPPLPRRVKSARLLADGRPLVVQQTAAGLTVPLPEAAARDPYDTVVALEMVAK